MSFQFGLVEREINELLRGRTKQEQKKQGPARPISAANETQDISGDGKETLEQRPITEDDVCPICQDELLGTREPVTYCRSELYIVFYVLLYSLVGYTKWGVLWVVGFSLLQNIYLYHYTSFFGSQV